MNFPRHFVLSFACLTFSLNALHAAESQNWPRFRGTGATGIPEGEGAVRAKPMILCPCFANRLAVA